MRQDIGSHYKVDDVLDAQTRGAATNNSTSIDHAEGACGAFFLSCGIFAGTSLVMTLQHSDDDASSDAYIDEVTGAGNDVSVTLDAAGSGQINVPNPRERYSRVEVVGDGECEYSVTSIIGPLRTLNAQ